MTQPTFYNITVPIFKKHLRAIDAMLDTLSAAAQARALDWAPQASREAALLNDRIVFDQFPFLKQVQSCCDQAKNGIARVAQIEAPKFDDTEQTVPELKARIGNTIAFLDTITPEMLEGKGEVQIVLPYFPGKYMLGFGYITEYVIPNFFFHATTAYSILRKNGIEVGKSDFIGGLPLHNSQ